SEVSEVSRRPAASGRSPTAVHDDDFGRSSDLMVPYRSQPTRPSQVRAVATGGGPIPCAGGGSHQPENHAADEHGSIPATCFKCFRKLVIRSADHSTSSASRRSTAGSRVIATSVVTGVLRHAARRSRMRPGG